LRVIHRRVINRFQRFLLWLGYPRGIIQETKITQFCKILSEFALEYRTTRERITTQKQKKQNRGERNKTRGLLITEVGGPLKDVLMNGHRIDGESVSTEKVYSSNIPQNYDIRSSSSISDKSSKQQSNPKNAQPNMLSDLAAVVKSTSIDGQSMPGHRLREKASSMFSLFN